MFNSWLTLYAAVSAVAAQSVLEVMNEWSVLEWTRSGPDYDPTRAVPVSLEVTPDRIFLAVPRLFSGLPASLGVIPRNRVGRGILAPKLQAWPNERWHEENASCNRTMVNVFRMRLDNCGRIWVLDSGVRDTFQTFTVQCPPKILVFDLSTDELVQIVEVPSDLLRRNSLLTNLVLDEQVMRHGQCGSGLIVYMSDASSPSIIVWNPAQDSMWRLSHPYMYPDPDHGVYTVEGESFTLMDGILGMALTPPGTRPKRLFFQPFASDRIFSVETEALQQGPNMADDSNLPVRVEGRKTSQAAGMIFDHRDGSLYFSPVSEEVIISWIPGLQPRTVAQNRELLQFVLDMRAPPSDSHIWIVSTKLQKYVNRDVKYTVPHIRLIRIKQQYFNNSLF